MFKTFFTAPLNANGSHLNHTKVLTYSTILLHRVPKNLCYVACENKKLSVNKKNFVHANKFTLPRRTHLRCCLSAGSYMFSGLKVTLAPAALPCSAGALECEPRTTYGSFAFYQFSCEDVVCFHRTNCHTACLPIPAHNSRAEYVITHARRRNICTSPTK